MPEPRTRAAPEETNIETRLKVPRPKRGAKDRGKAAPPRRSAPYDEEPGFYEPAALWLYGNVRLLRAERFHIEAAHGETAKGEPHREEIEAEVERRVLDGGVLVCGVHSPAHRTSAVVPLRWGGPRIVVLSGGFLHHLGKDLADEPFREARLWRYRWDPRTDLAVSGRAPDRPPTFAVHNPTVDRLIRRLALATPSASASFSDPLGLAGLRSRRPD